jgi:hypothetical protein
VSPADKIESLVKEIVAAPSWNKRVGLIRKIPEVFGKAQHQSVYASVAEAAYVPYLAPDFAYIHWREDYELPQIEHAYERAHALTRAFTKVDVPTLARAIESEPVTLQIFRLLLGFTKNEFDASEGIVAAELRRPLTNAEIAAEVVDRAMRGVLFPAHGGGVRSKIDKPDTVAGWDTVRKYAAKGVPFPVFLHQRHYGGAFRQLLDATSSKRGDLLEDAVEELFVADGIRFVRTGPHPQEGISKRFGLTVKPAPDFVVHDAREQIKAILECKQVNDGGTARDKAARFAALRAEAMRLGGIPVFAVLAGLGWRRTQDALGPVVRDTDGRVFTVQTLPEMMSVEPFPGLRG